MELNRNHYFMAGILLVLLGLQFRSVESFVLNEKASSMLAQHSFAASPAPVAAAKSLVPAVATPRKVLTPPTWLGYSLLSIGSVLTLHSLAMRKPGG